jgi:hypothetical protein
MGGSECLPSSIFTAFFLFTAQQVLSIQGREGGMGVTEVGLSFFIRISVSLLPPVFIRHGPPYDLNHNLNYPSVFLGSFRLIMSFPFRVSVIEKSHRAIRSHHSSLSLLPREHTTQDQFTCSSQPQVCQRHASCSLDNRKEATRPAGRFNPKSAQT